MNPLKGIIGALMFITGMIMYMALWTPLITVAKTLVCSTTMAMSDVIWGIILLIPALVILVGIIAIVSSVFEPSYPQQQQY